MTDEIVKKVREIIADECDVPLAEVFMPTTFVELGIDSLDLLQILARIREEVGPVEDRFITRIETVEDLAAAVGASRATV